jgi:hypothetical protein
MFPSWTPILSAGLGLVGASAVYWKAGAVRLTGLILIGLGVFLTAIWAYFGQGVI